MHSTTIPLRSFYVFYSSYHISLVQYHYFGYWCGFVCFTLFDFGVDGIINLFTEPTIRQRALAL